MASKTHSQTVAERCIKDAKKLLGPGWRHVSLEMRRGLVDSQILDVILAQDESLPAATVLGYLRELAQAVDAILDGEER